MSQNPYASAHPVAPVVQELGAPSAPPEPWDVGDVLGVGWSAFKANWVTLAFAPLVALILACAPLGVFIALAMAVRDSVVAFIALVSLGTLITVFVAPFLHVGLIRVALAAARGERATFAMLFSGKDRVVPMLLVSLISGVMVEIGLLCLVFPGVVLGIGLFFAPYYVVEQNMGPLEAMRASWAATRGQRMRLFVYQLVVGLVVQAGMLTFGLGLAVALPVVLVGHAAIYLRIAGRSASTRVDAPAAGYGAPPSGGFAAPHGYYGQQAGGGYGPPGGYPPGGGGYAG